MNSKSIRILTFVFLLTTILLLSLNVGTNVLAKPNNPNKPDNPGKHDIELPVDFKIWIGNGDLSSPEDVVLQPYGDPEMNYLLFEDWPNGERGWLPSTTKAKGPKEGGWGINYYREPSHLEYYYGTYNIANKLGGPGYEEVALLETMVNHGFTSDLEAYGVSIFHATPDLGPGVGDQWHFFVSWILENSPWRDLMLSGWTNEDNNWEGVYDQDTDTWTVTFDGEWFEAIEEVCYPDGEYVRTTLWEGQLSFTVEIQRILP